MPTKENVETFVEYFVGMKCRLPIYKDGSAGKPEVKQRFVSLDNEEDLAEYKLVKVDEEEDEDNESEDSPSMNISGEEFM